MPSTRWPRRSRTIPRTRWSSSSPATPACSMRIASACSCRPIPFPADAPEVALARDVAPRARAGVKFDPSFVLPYSVVALNLMRLKALDRLVIVDACQAESILQDPQVAAIQKWMEQGAARPGPLTSWPPAAASPPLEVDPLGHGLFTYTLLRALGEIKTRGRARGDRRSSASPPTPISTRTGSSASPSSTPTSARISRPSPASSPRSWSSREADLPVGKPRVPAAKLEQHPVLQSFGSSFPLVPLAPRKPDGNP